MQEQEDGPRVIAYANRSLSDVERQYSQTEKEALALVWACEKLHPYIYGIDFELVTDHKPLQTIFSPRSKPCARIERWVLRMQSYTFKVVYAPGRQNIADPLSRHMADESPGQGNLGKLAEDYVRFVAMTATPAALTTQEVEKASKDDEELSAVRECIRSGNWDKCPYKKYCAVAGELCSIGYLILRGSRIVLPQKLRPTAVTLAHEGYLGIVGTKQTLRTKVWWPGLEKDVEKYCPTTLPEGPWQDVAVDFLGPMPTGESILVVVDYYSTYYEIAIMRSTTSEKTILALRTIFACHGLPRSLKSDNGPQFRSDVFRQYLADHGIVHHRVTPLWPQANGEVERQNASIEKRLKIAAEEGKDWREELITYLAAYRAAPHATTGVSPAKLLFGREIRNKLPHIGEATQDLEVRDRDAEIKGRDKLYADERHHAVESNIRPGDEVLVRVNPTNKLSTPFNSVPHRVIAKSGNQITIQSPAGVRYKRNVTHLKKYNQPEPERVDVRQSGCAEQHSESTTKQSVHAEQHVKQSVHAEQHMKQSIHAEQHVKQSIHGEQHDVNMKQSISIDQNHSGHMETSDYETQAVPDEKLSVSDGQTENDSCMSRPTCVRRHPKYLDQYIQYWLYISIISIVMLY